MLSLRRPQLLCVMTLVLSLMLLAPLSVQTLAQNKSTTTTTTTQSSPPAQTNSSQSTTTKTTTAQTTQQPAQTTQTETTSGVNPLWLVIGGIALLALLAVVLLSMRGRNRGDTVYESKTVVKKD